MRTGKGFCPFAEQVEGVTSYSNAPLKPVGTCDHAAGGFLSTMRSPSFWNTNGVSVHFAVGRKGEIVQFVSIFESPYAQGRLGPKVTWPHWEELGSPNPNTLFISTEHEDWALVGGVAHAVPGSEWTPEQYAADLKLKRWMRDECASEGIDLFPYGRDSLTGHYMFDGVNRAECPGKFWRDDYRARLFADLTGEDDMGPWKQEGNFWVFYSTSGVPVLRIGDDDPKFPGRISKNYGGTWVYLRGLDDAGAWLPSAQWHATAGD